MKSLNKNVIKTILLHFVALLTVINFSQNNAGALAQSLTQINPPDFGLSGILNLFPGAQVQRQLASKVVPTKAIPKAKAKTSEKGAKLNSKPKKNVKSVHKTRIVTFAASSNWRTECVYQCNRKPPSNSERFLSFNFGRPCPSAEAKVVSIVNAKWCCVLKKKKVTRVQGNGMSRGFHSVLNTLSKPPECSEPFDNAEAEDEDDLEIASGSSSTSASASGGGGISVEVFVLPGVTDTHLQSLDTTGIVQPSSSKKPRVTVYPYNNFEGTSETFELTEDCLTLHSDWHKRISSVNTHGTCFELCPYKNCAGSCIQVAPGTLGHNRLRQINFDKRVTSIKVCSAENNVR